MPEKPQDKIQKHLKKASEEIKEAADTARKVGDRRGADDLDGLSSQVKTKGDFYSPQGGL